MITAYLKTLSKRRLTAVLLATAGWLYLVAAMVWSLFS